MGLGLFPLARFAHKRRRDDGRRGHTLPRTGRTLRRFRSDGKRSSISESLKFRTRWMSAPVANVMSIWRASLLLGTDAYPRRALMAAAGKVRVQHLGQDLRGVGEAGAGS